MTIQPQDKYMVRFPDGLRDRIKYVAARNGRSMNAEIVATLEKEYPSDGGLRELLVTLIENVDDPSKKDMCLEIFAEIETIVSTGCYSDPRERNILISAMMLLRDYGLAYEDSTEFMDKITTLMNYDAAN